MLLFLSLALLSTFSNAGWQKCASENGYCNCWHSWVAYGHGSNWAKFKHVSNGIGCNNHVFGDPKRGTTKSCYCYGEVPTYTFDGEAMNQSPYKEFGIENMELSTDTDSATSDNLRGEAVTHSFHFYDRYNKMHVVSLMKGQTHHVFFPVHGGSLYLHARDINNPGFDLRTGSAGDHRWCKAQFTHRGNHIRAQFIYMTDSRISSHASNWDKFERGLENIKKGIEIAKVGAEIWSIIADNGDGDGNGKPKPKPKPGMRGRRSLDVLAAESVVTRTAATEYTFMGKSRDSSFYEPLLSKMGLSDFETSVVEFGGTAISDEGFSFFDRFEHVHEVKLNKDDELVIFFPTFGNEHYFYSKGINGSDSTVATALCDKLARWVEARFSHANGKVRAELKFFKDSVLSSNAIYFSNVESAVTSLESDSELSHESFFMPEGPYEETVQDNTCDSPKTSTNSTIIAWAMISLALAVALLISLAFTYKMSLQEKSVKLSDHDQV